MIGSNNDIGLSIQYNDDIVLTNVTVTNSIYTRMYIDGNSKVAFIDRPSTIVNNSSPGNGGGMWVGKDIVLSSNTEVHFINNTAKGVGGAIYVDFKTSSILSKPCTFFNFKPTFTNNYGHIAGNEVSTMDDIGAAEMQL